MTMMTSEMGEGGAAQVALKNGLGEPIQEKGETR